MPHDSVGIKNYWSPHQSPHCTLAQSLPLLRRSCTKVCLHEDLVYAVQNIVVILASPFSHPDKLRFSLHYHSSKRGSGPHQIRRPYGPR